MQLDAGLLRTLRASLPGAGLRLTQVPGTGLKLWLLDPATVRLAQASASLSNEPPYWAIAWPAGVAMAQMLYEQPELVRGKRVLDFGAGSGLVALAAAQVGAARVTACDTDPVAQDACLANAAANDCRVEIVGVVLPQDAWDVVFVADVLYDRLNLAQVEAVVRTCDLAIVGDCRFRGAPAPQFHLLKQGEGQMTPDFGDRQFQSVQMYVKQGYTIQSTH